MHLTPVMEKLILHWGEMGTRWGVNRSVAQIHALLYLAGRPLTADEIAETLTMARSNVSTSLRELLSWGIATRELELGDRREYFRAESDLWQLLLLIAEGRKLREVDPMLTVLRQCATEGSEEAALPADVRERIERLLEFVETLTRWYEQVSRLSKPTLIKLMKLGGKVANFVGKG